jgi:hypothetical protein
MSTVSHPAYDALSTIEALVATAGKYRDGWKGWLGVGRSLARTNSPCRVGHRDQLIGGPCWKLNMKQYTNLTGIRDVPCLDRSTTIIYGQ